MKFILRFIEIGFLLAFGTLCILGSIVLFLYAQLPDVTTLNKCMTTQMYKVYLCKGSENYVTVDQISAHLKDAILVSEDVGFYGHNGFDFAEIRESFRRNLAEGRYARGGSTISQQLSKNVFLTENKSIIRKIKEALITYELEKSFSKDFIFEKYINVVEFGRGIYGVKKASLHYFSKPPSDLTPLEASFLAFLLPSPEKYSMNFYKKKLTNFTRDRLNQILFKMNYYKKISDDEYEIAKNSMETFFSTESPAEDTDPIAPVEDFVPPAESDESDFVNGEDNV